MPTPPPNTRPRTRRSLSVIAIYLSVAAMLSGCAFSVSTPAVSQALAEEWANEQVESLREAYSEFSDLRVEARPRGWCGYEELSEDDGYGTTELLAEVRIPVNEARTLLRRIGDDYADRGWTVWGEGDYWPAEEEDNRRDLFPRSADGHPDISFAYDVTARSLHLTIKTACYRLG